MDGDKEIERKLEEIMAENNVGYRKISAILSKVAEKQMKEGKAYLTDEEFQKYEKFKKEGNNELELAVFSGALTDSFAHGIQTVKAMFDDVDFSKPFRIVVDYDPEQPRTIVRKYLTKEAHESYSASIREMLKD